MDKFPTVFDCTLREVGYQTGWFFDIEFCHDLYVFAQTKGINYIELGFFHNSSHDKDRGIYRYCSEKADEISHVFRNIKNRVKLSSMIDIQRPLSPLVDRDKGVIDAIRILTRSHDTDLNVLKSHVEEIIFRGYELFINFTSAGYNTMEQNSRFVDFAVQNNVSTVYFADTESVMTEQYVIDTIEMCKKANLKVGMHFHNKNGTAEKLAELALQNNVDCTDVTLLGLGGKWRDGNLPVEFYLNRQGISGGFELTHLKNGLVGQLIKYNIHTAAV